MLRGLGPGFPRAWGQGLGAGPFRRWWGAGRGETAETAAAEPPRIGEKKRVFTLSVTETIQHAPQGRRTAFWGLRFRL